MRITSKISFAFILAVLLMLPAPVVHAEDRPDWSVTLKGGVFFPQMDRWLVHYDDDYIPAGGLELGWKPIRQLEISVNANYTQAETRARTLSGRPSGETITLHLVPVHASLLYRFVYGEDQLVVPYAGGGYTHTFYKEEFGGRSISGDQSGYHVRCGVQFLLDYLEPDSSLGFEEDSKLKNTYLIIEGVYSKVDDFDSTKVDLGGWDIFSGILLEF